MKKIMPIVLTFILTSIAFAFLSKSDETALKLVEAASELDASKLSDTEMDQYLAALRGQVTEEQYSQLKAGLKSILQKVFDDPDVRMGMAKVYQTYYTVEEMELQIEFFQSTAWEKFNKHQNEIEQKESELIRNIVVNKYSEEIGNMVDGVIKK